MKANVDGIARRIIDSLQGDGRDEAAFLVGELVRHVKAFEQISELTNQSDPEAVVAEVRRVFEALPRYYHDGTPFVPGSHPIWSIGDDGEPVEMASYDWRGFSHLYPTREHADAAKGGG